MGFLALSQQSNLWGLFYLNVAQKTIVSERGLSNCVSISEGKPKIRFIDSSVSISQPHSSFFSVFGLNLNHDMHKKVKIKYKIAENRLKLICFGSVLEHSTNSVDVAVQSCEDRGVCFNLIRLQGLRPVFKLITYKAFVSVGYVCMTSQRFREPIVYYGGGEKL